MHELLEQLDLLAEALDHIREQVVTALARPPEVVYVERIADPEVVFVERLVEVERVIEVEVPAEPGPCPQCGPPRPPGYDVLERRPAAGSARQVAREALRELGPARRRRLR